MAKATIGPVASWFRRHPLSFAGASGLFMFLLGLLLFGDVRAGLAGGLATSLLIYMAWRPGGFGYRLDEWNIAQVARNDGEVVRWRWALKSSRVVVLAMLALFALLVLIGEALG